MHGIHWFAGVPSVRRRGSWVYVSVAQATHIPPADLNPALQSNGHVPVKDTWVMKYPFVTNGHAAQPVGLLY